MQTHLFLCRSISILLLMLGGLVAGSSVVVSQATPGAVVDVAESPQFFIDSSSDPENQWFEVTLESGESDTLVAGVHNSGNVTATLRAFVTNASTATNGGFQPGAMGEELGIPGQWIQFSTEEFTIEPGETRDVAFSVVVPDDTEAGFYVAALVVQTTESFAIRGSETFRQVISNSVSIEITVPGEMTSGFELGNPAVTSTGNEWILDVPITNTGTARLRPNGELRLFTQDGEVVSTTPITMGSVYGGNRTAVRIILPGQLPLGEYLVSLDLIDEATGATASIVDAPVTLAEEQEASVFSVDVASVAPNADPIQYADVAATITNNGQAIPTANVTLVAQLDGETVESYPLAANQALPQGTTEFAQRYIPIDGWQPGTWTFELVISAVSGSTETVLATVEITDEIVVP